MNRRTAPVSPPCGQCACQSRCLFARLDDAAHAPWRPHLSQAGFHKGELLQSQGELPGHLQVLKVGLALVQRSGHGAGGPAHSVGLVGGGQVLGMAALLDEPAELSYRAVTPGRVCRLALDPGAAPLPGPVLHALAREQLQAAARLAEWGRIVRLRGVPARLAGALLQLADLQRSPLVRLPSHTVLAALLATTRESVARALAQLAGEQAVLRRDRWHCEIERTRLQALARGARRSPAQP